MKTLAQLSKDLKIPVETLYSAVKTGRIPGKKIGRDWFVYDGQVEFKQFLERYKARDEKNKS